MGYGGSSSAVRYANADGGISTDSDTGSSEDLEAMSVIAALIAIRTPHRDIVGRERKSQRRVSWWFHGLWCCPFGAGK